MTSHNNKQTPEDIRRILVVDDDTYQLRSIKRYLNASGLLVVTCTSAEEAIAALEGIHFSTVLSDIQLPEESGISLIKWTNKNLPHVPIFAMTAFGTEEIYRDVLQCGAVVYLEKPVDLKLLVQLLATSTRNCKHRNNFVTACLEAASSKGCGEVIVQNSHQIGQIFFYHGKIAWAAVQSSSTSFVDILCQGRKIKKNALSSLITNCRKTNTNIFTELVDQKVVKAHELHAVLHRYISTCFTQCLQWEKAQATFVPSSRGFNGQMVFDLVDILTLANTTEDLHLCRGQREKTSSGTP